MLSTTTQHPKANDTCTSPVTLVSFVPGDILYHRPRAWSTQFSEVSIPASWLRLLLYIPSLPYSPGGPHSFCEPLPSAGPISLLLAFIPEILGSAKGCRGSFSSAFLVFHQLGIPLETAWKSSHHWEAPVPTPAAQLWSPGLWQVCVGVWLWRFTTCGKKEVLPLEVFFFLPLNKRPMTGPPGEQTKKEEASGLRVGSLLLTYFHYGKHLLISAVGLGLEPKAVHLLDKHHMHKPHFGLFLRQGPVYSTG